MVDNSRKGPPTSSIPSGKAATLVLRGGVDWAVISNLVHTFPFQLCIRDG